VVIKAEHQVKRDDADQVNPEPLRSDVIQSNLLMPYFQKILLVVERSEESKDNL
jgi:hypothetical protein